MHRFMLIEVEDDGSLFVTFVRGGRIIHSEQFRSWSFFLFFVRAFTEQRDLSMPTFDLTRFQWIVRSDRVALDEALDTAARCSHCGGYLGDHGCVTIGCPAL